MKWDNNYYLIYNDKKIDLGKKVIVYNTITGRMKLYGKFYEINSDGKIVENRDETILSNTTDCKFYKIDDREYLLVDRIINSDDKTIEGSNYVLVELDKAGNAKLSNNKINLKTISPTKLVTSKYTFDIANELLNFGKYNIDLKKIIGSTNQYVPDDKDIDKDKDKENNSDRYDVNNQGNIGNGIGTGANGGAGDVINNDDIGNVSDIGEILDKIKMTSIIRVVEGLSQIDIDYVMYDPYNEYKSVYVEVVGLGKVDVVYLSKIDTHITLDNLNANTDYKLNFIYTTSKVDEETGEEELVPYTFEQFDLRTKMPEYNVSVYKISKVYNTLTYKVNLQTGFKIDKVNVNLSFDYKEIDPDTMEVTVKKASIDGSVNVADINSKSVLGTFDISGYEIDSDTLLKLTVKNVVNGEIVLPINSTYTFRFGR